MIDAPNPQFPNRKFQIINNLGSGSQGQVYLVKAINWGINDSKQFAIKQQPNFNENELRTVNAIIDYQKQQQNQPSQVIKIYEIYTQNNQAFLVMETGEQDLYKYIAQKQQLSLEQKVKIMKQLSSSVYFFHETLKLIHRDIKPENFLKVGDEFKLIDFGLAKTFQDRFMTYSSCTQDFIRGQYIIKWIYKQYQPQNVGTPLFQAPEQIQGQNNYTFGVDIWSLGCVFYEFFTSQALFNATNILEAQNLVLNYNSKYLENKLKQDDMPQQLKNLLIQMLQFNPKDRLSIKEVISKLNQIQTEQFNNQNKNIVFQNNLQKNQGIPQFQQQINFNQQNSQIQFNPLNQQQKQQQLKDQDQKQIESNILIQQLMTILEKQNFQEQFKYLQDQQDKYQLQISEQIQLLQNQFQNNMIDLKNELKTQNQKQEVQNNNNNDNLQKIIQDQQLNIKVLELKKIEQESQIKEYNQIINEYKINIQVQKNQIDILKDKETNLLQLDLKYQDLIKDIEKYKLNEIQQQQKSQQLQYEIQNKQLIIEQLEKNNKILQEELSQSQSQIFQLNQTMIEDQKIKLQQLNQSILEQFSTVQIDLKEIKELENKFEIQINKVIDQLQTQPNQNVNLIDYKNQVLQQNQTLFAEINKIRQIIEQIQQNKINNQKLNFEFQKQQSQQIKENEKLQKQLLEKSQQLEKTQQQDNKKYEQSSQQYQKQIKELNETIQEQKQQLDIQKDNFNNSNIFHKILENIKIEIGFQLQIVKIKPQNQNNILNQSNKIKQNVYGFIEQIIKEIIQMVKTVHETREQIKNLIQYSKQYNVFFDQIFKEDSENLNCVYLILDQVYHQLKPNQK